MWLIRLISVPGDAQTWQVLDRATGYMDHLIKEAIQIRLNYKNFNRDGDFTPSQAWYPVTNLLSKHKAGSGSVVT